jgi:hypothetical protein
LVDGSNVGLAVRVTLGDIVGARVGAFVGGVVLTGEGLLVDIMVDAMEGVAEGEGTELELYCFVVIWRLLKWV